MEATLYETLLVGLDEQLESKNAVLEACRLAQRYGARLELLHAVPVPATLWPGVEREQLTEMHAQAVERAREELGARLESEFSADESCGFDLADCLDVVAGHPAHALLERATEISADLLLLGPHKKRGTLEFANTLRAVLSKSEVPVWIQGEEPRPLRRILVAVDFSEESKLALEHAILLAKNTGASLRLLHAFQPPAMTFYNSADYWMPGPEFHVEAHEQEMADRLKPLQQRAEAAGLAATMTVERAEPIESILRHADEVDLVLMGTHGRTGLSRFVLGSNALGVLSKSPRHVMVVPRPGREWMLSRRRAEVLAAMAGSSF